jgi:hypothetical protein
MQVQGRETVEAVQFDKYIGIAPFYVLAVNPSEEGLKKIYPNSTKDFVSDYEYKNDETGTTGINITFYLKVDEKFTDANIIVRANYTVQNAIAVKADKSKLQLTNDYGEYFWVTPEEYKTKSFPAYAQSHSQEGLRPAYKGEDELVKFLKVYLGIPGSRNYNRDTKVWSLKTGKDLEAAGMHISESDVKSWLVGNLKTIKDAITPFLQKNKIKFALGVNTNAEGREYQNIAQRFPISLGTNNYAKFDKALTDAKAAGAFSTTEFGKAPYKFQVYTVEPTQFKPEPATVDPWSAFGTAPSTVTVTDSNKSQNTDTEEDLPF